MKTTLETKNAAVAAISANSTLVLFAAVVDGNPTAAQIETARYSVAANLENVGATATSAYLTRFEPVAVDVDESLLLTVDATLSKVAPDPLPDAEAEPLDETSLEVGGETDAAESESNEEVANESNNESDAMSTDAAAIDETAVEPETSEA